MHAARFPRLRPLRGGRFFVAAPMVAMLLAGGCGPSEVDDERSAADRPSGTPTVIEGMSKEQVLSLWGTPNVKVRQEGRERWSYWMRDDRQQPIAKTYVFFDARDVVSEVVVRPLVPPAPVPEPPMTRTRGPRPDLPPPAGTA